VALLGISMRAGWAGRVGSTAIIALSAAALVAFDQRDPFGRYVEASYGRPHPFQDLIPASAQVYWEDMDLAPIWFMLHRASYAGGAQFSGLLFNEQTARDAMDRQRQTVPIYAQMDHCTSLEGFFKPGRYRFADCIALPSDFFRLCQGQPHADYLVAQQAYTVPPVATWRFDPNNGSAPVDYRLYDCRAVRAALGDALAPAVIRK
jgi:hypothetical protein